MSKKNHEVCNYNYGSSCCGTDNFFGLGLGYGNNNNCCCNFSTLVILILIILQFTKKKSSCHGKAMTDNSILFIIALFFLACCNPCRKY